MAKITVDIEHSNGGSRHEFKSHRDADLFVHHLLHHEAENVSHGLDASEIREMHGEAKKQSERFKRDGKADLGNYNKITKTEGVPTGHPSGSGRVIKSDD